MFFYSDAELIRSDTADAQSVRAYNAGVLLNRIWSSDGGVSRADLARQTGLSRSTVSAIVSSLISSGLIAETHVARSRAGRPPIALAFRDDAFGIIGIEMGASHVAAVLCDPRGRVLFKRHSEWDTEGDPAGTLRLIHRFVSEAAHSAGQRRVIGLGLAVPCPLDSTEPGMLSRRILPAWKDICIGEELFQRHQLPTYVDNDANLGALAERWWGAATDTPCATYIKVATGVGAGHIVDGRLFRGATGIAGEIGHTTVTVNGGHKCRCNLHGCLEAEIGSASIVQRAREGIAAGEATRLEDDVNLSLAKVVEAALQGDLFAQKLIDQAGQYLGVAIANLLNLMNPARVIVGGRLATAGDLLLVPLRRAILDRALWTSIERADVVLSELGDSHVAVGAATLVLEAALAAPNNFTHPRQATRLAHTGASRP
jgi:predicted NBD/HSP70 family sugar kinase